METKFHPRMKEALPGLKQEQKKSFKGHYGFCPNPTKRLETVLLEQEGRTEIFTEFIHQSPA